MQATPTLTASRTMNHELMRSRKAINQFIVSCSSSMRTPISNINGLAGLLARVESDEEKTVVSRLIKQRASEVEHMLDELQLFMSHFEE